MISIGASSGSGEVDIGASSGSEEKVPKIVDGARSIGASTPAAAAKCRRVSAECQHGIGVNNG